MKRFIFFTVVCFAILFSPLCAQQKKHIVFIPKSSDLAFWSFMRQGADQAVQENGNVLFTWRGPAYDDDTDSQIKIVEAYIKNKVDAMIIVPTDKDRLVEPLKKAAEAGIKIIVVDSGLSGDGYRNFIATDSFSGGMLAAKRMVELLGGKGKVLVFRTVKGSASTDARGDGFVDYITKNAPGIKIISDSYGGGSRGKAQASATMMLKKHPDVDGIFAVNEASADGMLRSLRAANLAGKVQFVGFDSNDYLLDGLAKNEVGGLVVQDPRSMGYLGVKSAIDALNNVPAEKKNLYIQVKLVTPENFKQAEIQKLLYP